MSRSEQYVGRRLTVIYDEARCIRAEACLNASRAAFDRERDPWVQPDAVPAALVMAAVEQCPSGALSYRVEGVDAETPPDHTVVTVVPDGPLYVHGPISSTAPALANTGHRVALCRCGATAQTPLCDGACREVQFQDPGVVDGDDIKPPDGGPCRIIPMRNGPVILRGWVEIRDVDGTHRRYLDKVALCRCGASKNKPLCDGGHNKIDFRA